MKLAYFGLPLGALLLLADGHELAPCVLSPAEAPGRRRLARRLPADSVLDARLVTRDGLEHAVARALRRSPPELLVSWFWTRLLPREWLAAAVQGAVGVHPSLLPRHRGPNPYFWSIDQGDARTGVTLHTLGPEYDTGAILLQRAVDLRPEFDAWRLARALDRPSLALLREGVGRFARSQPPTPSAQLDASATWAPEPTGDLLKVDWRWPTARVLRRIRALSPVPGLALEIAGLPFFVTRARAATEFVAALEPGEAAVVRAGTVVIRTADGAIALERASLDSVSNDGAPDDDGDVLAETALAALIEARLETAAC